MRIYVTTRAFPTRDVSLVPTSHSLRALYVKTNIRFRLYDGFHGTNFPANSCLALREFLVQTGLLCYRSVSKQGHFTWREIYLLGSVFDSTGAIFMKIYMRHSTHICYKFYKFGWERKIIRDTLLEE